MTRWTWMLALAAVPLTVTVLARIFITRDDTMYVTDSESGPDTGAHERAGIRKGSALAAPGTARSLPFIEDSESTAGS